MAHGSRQPAIFISHGGGPWPYIDGMREAFALTERELRALPATLPGKPTAILSISGHWEEEDFAVATGERPPMIYDYTGFPEHTYRIAYPAPGSPDTARRVRTLLTEAGIACIEDPDHGFDHGTFVPVGLMYPQADVPIVSMSLRSNYNPADHLRVGQALKPLRDEGVLILGSGLSYHNMRGFGTAAAGPVSEQFEDWLMETVLEADPEVRKNRLMDWESAPAARLAHPREDHLLPLMVVAGTAGSGAGRRMFLEKAMGVVMASYRFD